LNLKWLEHLIAIEEEGSMAAAARRVHLSQPALTRSIQGLEAEAGVALCDRRARGVTLTMAGRMAADRARRILFETRCLERDLTLVREHQIGNVQIGLGPLPAVILLPDMLCTMHRDWPKLRISAEVKSAPVLLTALHAEKLDFIIVERRAIPMEAELKVWRLRPDPSGLFVRADHPLSGKRVTRAEVREAMLVSVPLPAQGHALLRKVLGCKPGESLPFQVESNDFHALAQLTCQTDVVLLAPARALRKELETGALIQLDLLEFSGATMEFAVVHLAQRTLSPAAERAIAAIDAVT